MTSNDSIIRSRTSTRRKLSFSLAGLLGILTISAVLLAWLVDHRRLVEQIGPPQQKIIAAYQLSNASPELASQKLNELFENDRISPDPNSNSVIVVAERIDHERISMILRHIDRKDTEFAETESQVSKVESETLPPNPR